MPLFRVARSARPSRVLPAILAALAVSAALGATDPMRPRAPTPPLVAEAGDLFEDVTQRAGIDFVHSFPHQRVANILLSNGAGAVVFDYDNDGWMDLYFVNWGLLDGVTHVPAGTPRASNRLYHNRGDGTFEDVTHRAGLEGSGFANAAAAGDFDNDGFTDLYVVKVGRSQLLRNRGDGTFEDVTDKAGVGHVGTGVSAVFLDYDNDGRLDLFLANYLTYVPQKESEQNPGLYPGPLAYAGEPNVLYRNRGDGTFEDVTREAGLLVTGNRAMSVSAFDYDRDGHVDLYVSNDDTPNQLWRNDGHGHFQDIAKEAGVAFNSIGEAPGSMNAAIGDVDGDGLTDLFVTRFGYDSLYVRTPDGFYDDRMWKSGLGRLTQRYVGWGGELIDYDNDGNLDLVIANGDAFKLEGTRALLLRNEGHGTFADASAAGGVFFRTAVNGRGNAALDYDNDGRPDLLITALADRPFLLHNRAPAKNHWLAVRLHGTRSNRNGYGALLTLKAGEQTIEAEARCATGFLTQSDPRPHFGLGAHGTVDRLEIRWPSGQVQVLVGLSADRIVDVQEPKP